MIRLNRYISNAGICSRRKADELISAGVISVNGEVVSELGYKIDPNKDAVRYNGELLKRETRRTVLRCTHKSDANKNRTGRERC